MGLFRLRVLVWRPLRSSQVKVFNLIRHTRSYDTRHDDRRQRFDGALLQASSSQNLNVAPANTCAATTDEISGKWNVREGVPDEGKELREYT